MRKISLILLALTAGLISHVCIILAGAPQIFWIVDLQTALISAVVEMITAPILLIIGLWKFVMSWHDRPRPISRDVFTDENQLC